MVLWEQTLALARQHDEQIGLATRARRHLAALALTRGDNAHAKALFEENLALARAAGSIGGVYLSLIGLADLARLQNDYSHASALCAEGLTLARTTGDRYATSRLLCIQGHIARAQGDHDQARGYYQESLSLAAIIEARDLAGHCLLGMAQAALAAGQWQPAARLFAAATCHLPLIRQLPLAEQAMYERGLEALHTRLDAGTFAQAWAEGEAVAPQQALELLSARSNAAVSAARSRADTGGAAPPNSQPPTSPHPDGLTAREVEVLRLVAQGWTDAQVAEYLVISTRTVNAHLAAIYRKIRVSSRHAATHYALHQHLI